MLLALLQTDSCLCADSVFALRVGHPNTLFETVVAQPVARLHVGTVSRAG